MTRVFVFGTLVGRYDGQPAVLHGVTKNTTEAYPTIQPGDDDDRVEGELIDVDNRTLETLDFYESYYPEAPEDSFYWRINAGDYHVYVGNGSTRPGWGVPATMADAEDMIDQATLEVVED